MPARLWIQSPQPGRDHARVVQHEHVARAQEPEQIRKLPVFDRTGVAMHDEQSGLVALGGGRLGDQSRR